ncbi:MAG: type II and III secretion system protein, partial [Verrucomicrobiae bacterium]|nr:type II and III secretion system protein [Verrucomicrobiae bacterium]
LGDDFEFGFDLLRTLETTGPDGRRYNGAGIFKSRTGASQSILDINTLDVVENFLPAAQGFTFYGQINPYLNAFLSTLSNTNRFKVLSRPTVYTVNNKQAVIQTGQRIAVPRSTQSSLDTSGNSTTNQIVTASIDYEEVVLRIQVLPLINEADEITLRIQQLNDDIIGSTIIGGDAIPTIGTQSLGTTVMIPDGSTVLLGGLISEDETGSESGLPTFTNLPLLGKVFGSNKKSSSRQELLIFIQPKIIDDPRDQESVDQDLITRTKIGPDVETFAGDQPAVKAAPAKPEKNGWLRRLFQSK